MQEVGIYIEYCKIALEVLGVMTIIVGTFLAIGRFVIGTQKVKPRSYKILRQELGKSILLGLEILVAGDIIATVATVPTMESVLILAIIILIRTFLSLSIQVEIEGKFPWQKKTQNSNDATT